MHSEPNYPVAVFVMAIVAFGYLFPTIVAVARDLKNKGAIAVLNVFLGWTLIGWVGALVWATAGTATKTSHPLQERP